MSLLQTNVYKWAFLFADKFAILTNNLVIIRHICFIDDDDFKTCHHELFINQKSDLPNNDKYVGDSTCLVPVLNDFFAFYNYFHPKNFLGDASSESFNL